MTEYITYAKRFAFQWIQLSSALNFLHLFLFQLAQLDGIHSFTTNVNVRIPKAQWESIDYITCFILIIFVFKSIYSKAIMIANR